MRPVDTSPDLLDPKNDYVFKRLFVRAPELLVALINAVRPERPKPVLPCQGLCAATKDRRRL
ncbi:hypothetical protein CCR91_12595 [Thiorhodovibrio winogradskyi]|nr:hypothetical protein [Thiorhodovibrio winogradskyi]